MGLRSGKGVPTKSTEGCIGDIYTDLNDGKQYKCKSSYKTSFEPWTYEWEYLEGEPEDVSIYPDTEEEETVEEPIDISPVPEPEVKSEPDSTPNQRTNYNKQFKHNNYKR